MIRSSSRSTWPRSRRRRWVPIAAAVAVLSALGVPAAVAAPSAQHTLRSAQVAATDDPTVPNGSFEDATSAGLPAQWTVSGATGGNAATVTTDVAHDGTHSLEVSNPGPTGISVRSAHIPAQQNDRLTASAWVRGGSGAPAWLYLEYWRAGGGRIAERHVMPAYSADWQQVQVSLAAPPGTSYATVLVYGSTSTDGVSYYDDARLSVDPGETYQPALGPSAELFVDDYRVADTHDVQRVVHPGVKSDVLLAPTEPWEGKIVYLYGSVIFNPALNRYQMWYTAIDEAGFASIDYAVSRDGNSWTKPDLGLVDYHGSTANNIVLAGSGLSGGVIRDPSDPDPARRYKMLVYRSDPKGYDAYFSPDGLHWTAYGANPVIDGADVANVSYDPATDRFIALTKQPFGTRAAFTSTSTDFVHWTTPELALAADDRDRAIAAGHGASDAQIYGMPAFRYGNAYLALPWIFEITGAGEPGTAGDGTVQAEIAASRDLVHWGRPDRDPIVPLGTAGRWDDGMTFTANAPIVSRDQVTIYYSGWDGTHGVLDRGARIGKLTWRRDGFVSFANRGADTGTITTKPITFTGSTLHVNADLRRGGSLQVEVLDAAGNAVPGFGLSNARPVRGDQLDATVRWRGHPDLGKLAGQQVRLRFHLHRGDLYSFRIGGASG